MVPGKSNNHGPLHKGKMVKYNNGSVFSRNIHCWFTPYSDRRGSSITSVIYLTLVNNDGE